MNISVQSKFLLYLFQEQRIVDGIFLLGFLIYVVFFSPGFMSNDSVSQLLQARSGVYGDWHPPAMAILWRFVEHLGFKGGFGILLLQSFLIWLGAYLVHRAYLRQGGAWSAGALFLVLFFPPLFGIAGAIWKDNLMWGLLFVVIGSIGLVSVQAPHKTNSWDFVLAASIISILVSALLMRFNAVFAAGPLLLLLYCRLFRCSRLRSAVFAIVVAFITLILIFFLVVKLNDELADRKEHAWLSVALFDTVGVIVRLPEHSTRQELFENIPKSLRITKDADALIPKYDPRYWIKPGWGAGAPLKFRFDSDWLSESDRAQMMKLWISLPFKYPGEWLRHRFAVSENLLGLTNDALWSPVFMKTNGFSDKFNKRYGRNQENTELQKIVERRLQPLQSYFFFRPWFYMILAALIVAFAIFRFEKENLTPLLISLSGVLHEMALFLFAPSVDYRYSHYFIFSEIVAALLLFSPSVWKQYPPSDQ